MASSKMNEVMHHLRRIVLLRDGAGLTDGQLLGCFIEHRDEAAFAALVRRHGPMVWGLCRRLLDQHDTEDAFQATFLVLVRKAASIVPRERVANWLYGVARQTALQARRAAARRKARERQVTEMPDPAVREQDLWPDLQPLLDQELSRLPDVYREVIVLSDLEGKTRREVARQLGLPEGTVGSRLARARTMLAKRLARHSLAVSGGALAAVLSQQATSAGVPSSVVDSTTRAASLLAAGKAAATGAISVKAVALTEGVLKAMLMTKVKAVLGIGLVLGFLMLGSAFGYRTLAADKTAPEPPQDRLADTLILLDKQWWEAASRHDVDTINKIVADDWVAINPDDPKADLNKARHLDERRQRRTTDVTFLKERRVIRIDKHTAMMSYEVKWRTAEKGQEPRQDWGHGRFVNCWVQRDGGWFVKYTECVGLPVPNEWLAPVDKSSSSDPTLPIVPPLDAKTAIAPLLVPMITAPAWNKGVRASSIWGNDSAPENAFDSNKDTIWNSAMYAPGWIERDLGASRPLAGITLVTSQTPPCETIHEVWVSDEPIGNDRSKAKLVHTFKGQTADQQVLKLDFPKNLSARYAEILTTASESWIGWREIEIRVREEKVVPLDLSAESK
jgi:RNA polymerase sigma factor (sigma-70 family)